MKLEIEEIKRKTKDQIKQNKDVLEKKVREYIGYSEDSTKKLQEEIKQLKRDK